MSTGDASLKAFISLSEFLLGLPFQPPLPPLTALDPDLANTYYTAMSGLPNMALLLSTWTGIQKLPKNQWTAAVNTQIFGNTNLQPVAQNTLLVWYTGFHSFIGAGSPSPDPANYEQTLVWVLAQAHPMGVPLSFGYWQYAPQPQGA